MTEISDRIEREIFIKNKKSLFEVSLDDSDDKNPVNMVDIDRDISKDIVIDFDDVKIMLGNSGEGITAFGKGEGQDKVKLATEQIIDSPFIKNLPKARKILLSITAGPDIGLTDLHEVTMIINEKFAAEQTNILWGYIMDVELEDKIEVEMLITDLKELL